MCCFISISDMTRNKLLDLIRRKKYTTWMAWGIEFTNLLASGFGPRGVPTALLFLHSSQWQGVLVLVLCRFVQTSAGVGVIHGLQ